MSGWSWQDHLDGLRIKWHVARETVVHDVLESLHDVLEGHTL